VKEEKIVITQQDYLEYIVDEIGEGKLYIRLNRLQNPFLAE